MISRIKKLICWIFGHSGRVVETWDIENRDEGMRFICRECCRCGASLMAAALLLAGCGRESATLAGASSDCARLAAAAASAAFVASATFEKRYIETTLVFRYRVDVAQQRARLFDVTQQPFATEVAIGAGGRSFQGDGCSVNIAADGGVTVTN